jgi:hypothetical protein
VFLLLSNPSLLRSRGVSQGRMVIADVVDHGRGVLEGEG